MIKIYNYGEVPNSEIFARENISANVEDIVAEIIADVRKNGDEALFAYSKKPALAEAVALNMADSTDAKLQTLTELFKGKTGTEWLGYNRLFESNLRRASED